MGIIQEVAWAVRSSAVLLEKPSVQILDDVHTIARHEWIEVLEGGDDIVHMVAAVIQDGVGYSELINYRVEESQVRLTSNADMDSGRLKLSTFAVDVYADNRRVRAEVALPHLQRTTLGDTNL